jgi:hypothetical protein
VQNLLFCGLLIISAQVISKIESSESFRAFAGTDTRGAASCGLPAAPLRLTAPSRAGASRRRALPIPPGQCRCFVPHHLSPDQRLSALFGPFEVHTPHHLEAPGLPCKQPPLPRPAFFGPALLSVRLLTARLVLIRNFHTHGVAAWVGPPPPKQPPKPGGGGGGWPPAARNRAGSGGGGGGVPPPPSELGIGKGRSL